MPIEKAVAIVVDFRVYLTYIYKNKQQILDI